MSQARMWHPDALNLKPETSHLKPYGNQGERLSQRGDGGAGSRRQRPCFMRNIMIPIIKAKKNLAAKLF